MTKPWRFTLPATDDLFRRIVTDGRRRRRRLLAGTTASIVAVLLLAATPWVLSSDGDSRDVISAGPETTTTAPDPTTSTTEMAGDTSTTSVTATSVPSPSSTTTTALVCRNSVEPACGPFAWDPPPGPNQPIELTVSYEPERPRVGETVTFTVRAQDPDAEICSVGVRFSNGTSGGEYCSVPAIGCSPEPHGPWDTPPRKPSAVERQFTYEFSRSGPADITVTVISEGVPVPGDIDDLCPRIYDHDPYGGWTDETVTIDVQP